MNFNREKFSTIIIIIIIIIIVIINKMKVFFVRCVVLHLRLFLF